MAMTVKRLLDLCTAVSPPAATLSATLVWKT